MKKLGFTCLKQTMPTPEWPSEKTLKLALEEGIIPFWYAEGGYEDITPELLKKLGLPENMDIDEAIAHPKMWEHQKELLRQRITRPSLALAAAGGEDEEKDASWVPSVVGNTKGHELRPEALPHFVKWLERQYGTVEALKEAWNFRHVGITERWHGKAWTTWDDVLEGLKNNALGISEYRHLRDALRFRADTFSHRFIGDQIRAALQRDPHEPHRAGGECGLFLPFASRGTDMEQIALVMADAGSFYPSLHLAWHFEEVDFEVARPVYMQAQIAADWAKGIWSATWESTGGPQYFSGGKAPFVEEARNKQPGFTTDEHTMEQLLLSYLAAGFKGFGLWSWNARTAGWEAGEYALVDRNRNVSPRAVRVGQIGQAARRFRRELWNAHKEPLVGILQDWENEAMWAAMGVAGRDYYKMMPVRARIGASRAFINANVPWEYVTARNIAAGLAPRYQCIYVPAFISISTELQRNLLAYVQQGGRLILDMPGAYYDEYGVVYNTDQGSLFEQTFGCVLNEFSYAAKINVPYSIEKVPVDGFTARLTPTTARIVAKYDQHDRPAITEARVGSGTALILAAQASLNCYRPGNTATEQLIVRHTLGEYRTPYACEGALVYRLAAPAADHYFLINDGPARAVTLNTKNYHYQRVMDAISGEPLPLSMPIALPPHGARWLRFEKGS